MPQALINQKVSKMKLYSSRMTRSGVRTENVSTAADTISISEVTRANGTPISMLSTSHQVKLMSGGSIEIEELFADAALEFSEKDS